MAYSGTLSGAALSRRFIRSETIAGSNIDSPAFATFFTFCMGVYLGIYALEAPIRYGLFLAGKDSLILVRDSLIIAPLFFLAAAQSLRLQLHAGFVIWAVVMAFHAMVLVGTVGSPVGAVYGAKVLINVLFGFFAAGLLISPGPRMTRWLSLLWLVIVVGVCLDKGGLQFPWTGIKTVIGDLNVDVSKDWEITDPLARRVAGFTRSSIAVASVLPCLSIVLLGKIKRPVLKGLLALVAIGAVFMTTQKGSIVALIPIAGILCVQPARQPARLRMAFLAFLIIAIGLPLLTLGLHMQHGAGVFSTESLYLRIAYTWPDAWKWIVHHQMLWFGVGLGGIGGPQRLYAPDYFNPSDNIAVLLYGYFGIFAIIYTGIVCVLALRPVTGSIERVTPALAVLAFAFGYGTVLSVIEDQSLSLFLGAAVGVLWRETRPSTFPVEASCRTART
jgi:hypothetical protein